MTEHLAVVLEGLPAAGHQPSLVRAVALAGIEPGLQLDGSGTILWREPRADVIAVRVTLGLLYLMRPATGPDVAVVSGPCSSVVPPGSRRVIEDGDELLIGGRRLRVRILGSTPEAEPPTGPVEAGRETAAPPASLPSAPPEDSPTAVDESARPLAVRLEDLAAGPGASRFTACVALPGREPGLRLTRQGEPAWGSPEDAAVELWVSADGRLVLYRTDPDAVVTVGRTGRLFTAQPARPVLLSDGDEVAIGPRRWRVHLDGDAREVAAPHPAAGPAHEGGAAVVRESDAPSV